MKSFDEKLQESIQHTIIDFIRKGEWMKIDYNARLNIDSAWLREMHSRVNMDPVLKDKYKPFRTFLHYSDPDASKILTVFGEERRGLFYNYEDRLFGKKWQEGLKLASEQVEKNSAKFYEIALNHFHDTDSVNIQHILLGCNRSTGYSYLVFGYTY